MLETCIYHMQLKLIAAEPPTRLFALIRDRSAHGILEEMNCRMKVGAQGIMHRLRRLILKKQCKSASSSLAGAPRKKDMALLPCNSTTALAVMASDVCRNKSYHEQC
jgi:hypothetical protein